MAGLKVGILTFGLLTWAGAAPVHGVDDAARQHSLQVDKQDPFAGLEGTWEGQCVHYAYGPVDESGRWVCTESPVSYPLKWVVVKDGDQYKVTSDSDKATIEHGDAVYTMPRIFVQDVPMTHKYRDDYGHCVRVDAGNTYGELRLAISKEGTDTVLVEDGHWHLVPSEDGQVVGCPPKSAYVSPLTCDPEKKVFGYKCTSYKRS